MTNENDTAILEARQRWDLWKLTPLPESEKERLIALATTGVGVGEATMEVRVEVQHLVRLLYLAAQTERAIKEGSYLGPA